MKNIVLFASGSGTNVENIIEYFKDIDVKNNFFVFTNNPDAFVIERAKKLDVPYFVFNKQGLKDGAVLHKIMEINPKAKVVMASSVGTSDHLKQALENGAYDFIQKPISLEAITNLIEKVLEEESANV